MGRLALRSRERRESILELLSAAIDEPDPSLPVLEAAIVHQPVLDDGEMPAGVQYSVKIR
jgi:hypothetical protein